MADPEIRAASGAVWYLGSDTALCDDLSAILERKGLRVTAFRRAADLESAADPTPTVLVLDMREVPPDGSVEALLTSVTPGVEEPPALVCVGGSDDMEGRLKAMRAGAKGFFPIPVSARKAAQKVIQLAGGGRSGGHRILVVEDDPSQAHYTCALLAKSGMETQVVSDPLKVLEALQAFRPDLVLMDLYMPGATGSELTAIIREDDELYDIPIVFLSAEEDPDRQLDALRVGGDSFLAKPVDRKALIGTIEHRIGMRRWLADRRNAASRSEPASGLLPKDEFMRQLDRRMHADVSAAAGWGLLLVELDSPRHILDRLGIVRTERLLRQLETQLVEELTSAECAARVGDFHYAVLARRADPPRLYKLAERLRERVSQTRFPTNGNSLSPTASVGIGPFSPPVVDALAMISRAHKAAAAARAAGGNRVHIWEAAVSVTQGSEADEALRELLEKAVAGQGFKLQFQPIVSVSQEGSELYEVQLRLIAPDGEHIPPKLFLPVAERHGMLAALDRWVLCQGLDLLAAQREFRPRLRLLIHQTLKSTASRDWLRWLRDRVVELDLIRQRPFLQFQMEDVRRNRSIAKPVTAALRKLGIQVCIANCSGIDSELELLAELEVTLVKLSFSVLTDTKEDQLTALLRRLQGRGIASIAAGIEDPATVARVWGCRPDFIQGNFLQMPGPDLSFELTHSELL